MFKMFGRETIVSLSFGWGAGKSGRQPETLKERKMRNWGTLLPDVGGGLKSPRLIGGERL